MRTISCACPKCHVESEVEYRPGEVRCPGCGEVWGTVLPDADPFERCFICGCRQFYFNKDFNRLLGCAVVLIAILFVPATYGLSLPAAALTDWLLYRRVPRMVVCYRCGAEYRHFPVPKTLKPFLHHIGLKYDKYR